MHYCNYILHPSVTSMVVLENLHNPIFSCESLTLPKASQMTFRREECRSMHRGSSTTPATSHGLRHGGSTPLKTAPCSCCRTCRVARGVSRKHGRSRRGRRCALHRRRQGRGCPEGGASSAAEEGSRASALGTALHTRSAQQPSHTAA